MPRIDPMKLLVCLSVLLAPNGGIRTAAEVKRLANLMAKFSKKLVSKCIYIQILKCTETELLGQFMQTGGWSLVHMWLVDGIGSKNWPLIQELLELLLCCPVDVERLKINSTPRLVKSLSTDSAHESVRVLATKLVEQWLYIVKAPKQLSSMIPPNQSEILGSNSGLAVMTDGKQSSSDQQANGVQHPEASRNNTEYTADGHQQNNVYLELPGRNVEYGDREVEQENDDEHEDDVDAAKKTFRTVVEQQDQPNHKKTSLVLKITTKNGKQVVAKVVSSGSKKGKLGQLNSDGDHDDVEEDEDEDEEEVLVNIESTKHSDDTLGDSHETQETKEAKKLVSDHHGGKEGSRERSSSSTKDKERHSRDREKDRKSSSSSGVRSSSSKSSSSGGSGSSGSSSSKHRSSSSSKSSSSSSSRDKDRHGGSGSSSSSSSNSKHKSSSSSSSKTSGSSSKSGSSSSSSDKHKDKSSVSAGSAGSSKESKDSKSLSTSPSSKLGKQSRKSSKDEGNDSGSESSSTTAVSLTKSSSAAGSSSSSVSSKKPSISIEVRNPENRPKTVKTYNSQFRSHGLIEEAPPPPSRKGLKKPSSSTSSSTTSSSPSTGTSVGSTASGSTKRSSPPPSAGRDGAPPSEKKLKEDPPERPGSIKLIPPKRQHALIESDMFMDALSATLRKDVKKRKRRTSGSENPATAKPGDVGKPDGGSTAKPDPESPTSASTAPPIAETGATETGTPTTPNSPKAVVPTIAPMSFYRDTLAEEDESGSKEGKNAKDAAPDGAAAEENRKEDDDGPDRAKVEEIDDENEAIVKKPKRVRCELNDDDDDGEEGVDEKKKVRKESEDADTDENDKTELMDVVMNDVEKKIAEEAEGGENARMLGEDDAQESAGKKTPGPGCGPDGPPGVLVIHRRKGPKKQLRWRAAEELEEVRYFELDVTERCNVTKSFTDMKQMERVDERQKFMLARKVGSEDNMVEKTPWRPLLLVDNVPTPPDGSQSVERTVQHQRERGCLQALYFNKHMIPDSPVEPEPADTYQTADPVHIPLEDVTGNPDSVNDFTTMPWPDPKSTPPHESAAFNSPFFPTDLPPAAGFGPGGFPPPFPPGAALAIGVGPAPWTIHPRTAVLQPGMFPLNQPPPGMAGLPPGSGGGGGSPNILALPPNIPPPGIFPATTNFNAPPPDLAHIGGGDVGGRRPSGAPDRGGADFRSGPPPPQQWVTNSGRAFGGNNQRGGAGFGNRGGGPGNWNRSAGSTGDRGRNGEEGRANYRGHWMQNNRGHKINNRGAGGRKW